MTLALMAFQSAHRTGQLLFFRMGRALVAAKRHPCSGTKVLPRVTLRLTRLEPNACNFDARPSLAHRLSDSLKSMGINVDNGGEFIPEHSIRITVASSPTLVCARNFTPTLQDGFCGHFLCSVRWALTSRTS